MASTSRVPICGAFLKGAKAGCLCSFKSVEQFGSIYYCKRHLTCTKKTAEEKTKELLKQHDKEDLPLHSDECAICADAIISHVSQKTLPCGHSFHIGCVLAWQVEQGKNT